MIRIERSGFVLQKNLFKLNRMEVFGVLYLNYYKSSLVEQTIFSNNYGGKGGAIFFDSFLSKSIINTEKKVFHFVCGLFNY